MNAQGHAAARAAFERQDYIAALTILNDAMDGTQAPGETALMAETLEKLGLASDAAEAFEQAGATADAQGALWLARAAMLHFKGGDDDRAQWLAMRARSFLPDNADIAFLLATLFRKKSEMHLVPLVESALVGSDNPEHLTLAGELIGDNEHNPLNLALFAKLAGLHPDDPYTQFKYLSVARDFCDFEAIERQETIIAGQIARGNLDFLAGESAYSNLLHCADERLNRLAVNNGLTATVAVQPAMSAKMRTSRHVWNDGIRIGYLSGDFWDDHATMRLFQSVLEMHDRKRFEVTLYCHTPEKFVAFDSGNRSRWGRIVQIGAMSDHQAAESMRSDGIDILVDLKGHTAGARSKILNLMVAPVQVAWLGFPGSAVTIDCDYVIGDPIVLPNSSKPHYHEKFCRLPECYQPNDPVYRPRPAATPRENLGLPADRFVFAAFNTGRKISLDVLECWADILRRAPATVLWIMLDGDIVRGNFLAAMAARGVGAQRVVFAGKTSYVNHVARLQAANLALDTFPYNGHTTTSDQLWAGLPVLTIKGSNFASRVSESLLTALGLPELVAAVRADYVEQAIELSNDPERLAGLRERIEENRFVAPLFDAERFCRHLEMAYEMMAERARQKRAPDHITVPALPARMRRFI